MKSSLLWTTVAIACMSWLPTTQAAWGFGANSDLSKGTPPPTPVDAAASPLPAADPIDASGFADAGFQATSSSPLSSQSPYTGLEYKFRSLVFRPAEFKMEGYIIIAILTYLVGSILGARQNRNHAVAWADANEPVFKQEFAGVGLGDQSKLLAQDGRDEFLLYATGRRGVTRAWTRIQTAARHDLFTRLYHLVRGIIEYGYRSGEDLVTVDFKLVSPEGTPGAKFCFSVVDRKDLRALRDQRWDLRELTTTSEQTGVDPQLIIMTENGDVTKAMLAPETGLKAAIAPGAPGLEWFQSLVITDGPADKPDEEKPELPQDEYHLILTLRLPPPARCAETRQWVSLACNIADVLFSKQKLVPDVQISKLKKRRTEALAPFLAAIAAAAKEEQDEKLADSVALKKKLDKEREDQRLAGMTKAERVKYFKKKEEDEKKAMIKKMSKTVKR